ncbi:MAG: hypothetical protein K2Q26_09795 [Bdellovibrionales bacterium]|nr:hypothetical protein [Bdellovibrionales bacterium]
MIKPSLQFKIKAGLTIVTLAAVFHLWSRSTPEVAVPSVEAPRAQAISAGVTPEVATSSKVETPSPSVVRPHLAEELPKITPHLERFSHLQVKALRTSDEEDQWAAMLSNPFILKKMQILLVSPTQEHVKQKNQALAFVLESLKRGESEAKLVLESLISDPWIESNEGQRPQLQFQAELKAEAMFTWSSLYPEQSTHIESLLPGPVSQKIWQNVVAQQDLNSSESELEL